MEAGSVKRVGLLGAGTVGGALLKLAHERDLGLCVTKVLVRDLRKVRTSSVPVAAFTQDPDEVLASADILVEVMGGTDLAGDLMLCALKNGKPVVTANKAVLAERWHEFQPYVQQGRVYFEASVMAGTPVIGPLTRALRGSRPLELHAILNGTCNYILSQLEAGVAFEDALTEAQRLGYAEPDPTLDIEGTDAAHKITILARLAFDPALRWEEVKARAKGISHLTSGVVKDAMKDGGRIRLVGSVYPEDGVWQVEVRPVYLPPTHPLASSASNRNGMLFKGEAVGEVFIAGAGAGAGPTASAVLADVITAAEGCPGPGLLRQAAPVPVNYSLQKLGEVA
jgi:homoserine dehydrogenase